MSRPVPLLTLLALAPAASAQTALAIAPSDARTVHGAYGLLSGQLYDGEDSAAGGFGMPVPVSVRWQALFPLTGVPAGATVVSATITTAILGTPRPFPHTLSAYPSAVGTLTTAAPTGTAVLASLVGSGGPKTVDATAAIRAYLATGTPYAGLMVACGAGTTGWSTPTLTVVYAPVPEPSALAALAIPVLALLRRRRP